MVDELQYCVRYERSPIAFPAPQKAHRHTTRLVNEILCPCGVRGVRVRGAVFSVAQVKRIRRAVPGCGS